MSHVLALLLGALVAEAPAPAEGGIWPTPPPPTSAPSDAPAAPAAGAGRPYAILVGSALGGTDQVERGPNGLLAFQLGMLVDPGAVRLGVMGSLGVRRDAGAWTLSLLAGRTLRRPGGAPLDLLGELGLAGFWQLGSEGWFERSTISGGDATLPYLGVRLILGPEREPGGGAVGLFVQRTLGQAREPYRLTRCTFLNPCTTEEKEARYGGWAVGITVDIAWLGRARPAPYPPPDDRP